MRLKNSYGGQQGFPISLVFAASVVHQMGACVKICDLYTSHATFDSIATIVQANKPCIWGITGNVTDRFEMFAVADYVKRLSPSTLVVMGGIFASQTYLQIMEDISTVDVVVRGEGEYALYELYLATQGKIQFSDINGISWRRNDIIVHNLDRDIIKDLNMLPYPAYDLLDYSLYHDLPSRYFSKELQKEIYGTEKVKVAELIFSRGCPFNCIFCVSNKHFYQRFRIISPERAVEHIEKFYKNGYRLFVFWDDHLLMNKKWFNKFYNVILQKNLKFKFKMSSRVDSIDEPSASKLREIGCITICLGIEYGDDYILDAIGKAINTEKIEQVIKVLLQNDIKPYGGMIINFPKENYTSIDNSIRFFKHMENCWVSQGLYPHPVQIYPGTVMAVEYWEKKYPDFRWTKPYFNKYNMLYVSSPYVPIWRNWSWVKEMHYLLKCSIKWRKMDVIYSVLSRILFNVDKRFLSLLDRLWVRGLGLFVVLYNIVLRPRFLVYFLKTFK